MGLRKEVTAEGVRVLRERRGWSLERMADEVWATPLEVAAWEAGTVRVPAAQGQRIRELAMLDHQQAVRAVGERPGCEWMQSNAARLRHLLGRPPGKPSDPGLVRHLERCEECRPLHDLWLPLSREADFGFQDPIRRIHYDLRALPPELLVGVLVLAFLAAVGLAGVTIPLAAWLPRGIPVLIVAMLAGAGVPWVWRFVKRVLRRPRLLSRLLKKAAVMFGWGVAWKVFGSLDVSYPALLAFCTAFAAVLTLAEGGPAAGEDGAGKIPLPPASARIGEGAPAADLGLAGAAPAEHAPVRPRP